MVSAWIHSKHGSKKTPSGKTAGNITNLRKQEDAVTIGLDTTVFDSYQTFVTTKDQLIAIINTWQKLEDKEVAGIIIKQDNNTVTLEEKNDPF